MNETRTVLIIDDEENIRRILEAMLSQGGYAVLSAKNISEARAFLKTEAIHVVLSDLRIGREDGLVLLKWMKEERYNQPIIILTAHGTVDTAVDAMKQGAFDYLAKPFERAELFSVIRKALLTFQYQGNGAFRGYAPGNPQLSMIGQSPKMQKIYGLIEKVAPTDTTVLITGDSGTGKELVAQALHDLSPRREKPFIKINCAAIPATLMESELFGHEKGAFTGASASKPGRFELADKGTLFLDEIGEMSMEMQVKLLRVLQEKTFERVGGIRSITVDVRLVAATNRDLEQLVKEGKFRGDLFYRLNVVPIHLPPLRERPDDIPRLARVFVEKFAERLKKESPAITPEALELLTQFPWPGNIRQLENVIERLMVIHDDKVIAPDQLPEEILEYEEERFRITQGNPNSLKDAVKVATRQIEKKIIEDALIGTEQNVTQAARKLNISRKGLQLKMKELGLR